MSWSDPEKYERTGWKLETVRGEHVRQRRLEKSLLFIKRGDLVLDVGVGPATISKDFPCTVVGCDLSLEMLHIAKKKINSVVRCDSQNLPFVDKAFDVSFESGCLYLIPNQYKALTEMVRVAKRAIITFESNRWSLRRLLTSTFSRYLSPLILKRMHKDLGLNPKMLMVGFAPFSSSKIIFKLWKIFEILIESLPPMKYLCGGILVVSNL